LISALTILVLGANVEPASGNDEQETMVYLMVKMLRVVMKFP
jgi:hypothetical protein